ncbi:LysR family transcriptional regulator [Streptomyces sp. NPDC001100]
MELRQLAYFVAVAEEANFTRAAERLHIAQSGVSAQIRRLEREFGQPLLDRSGRSVRLTDAGAAVLPYARAALDAAAAARHAVDELTGLLRGHLAIGTIGTTSAAQADLSVLLTTFHADHPHVEISMTVGNSDDLIDRLRARQCDVALIGLGRETPSGIGALVIFDEPLVAVVGPGHPLSDRDTISLATLTKHPLITLYRGTGVRTSLDAACAAASLHPQVICEATEPSVVIQLARQGLGIGVVPRPRFPVQAHWMMITGPQLRSPIALAWQTDGPASPATRAFLRRAHTTFRRPAAPPMDTQAAIAANPHRPTTAQSSNVLPPAPTT